MYEALTFNSLSCRAKIDDFQPSLLSQNYWILLKKHTWTSHLYEHKIHVDLTIVKI